MIGLLRKLENAATLLGVSAEHLLRLVVDKKLGQADKEFRSSGLYVLQKNADLYDDPA